MKSFFWELIQFSFFGKKNHNSEKNQQLRIASRIQSQSALSSSMRNYSRCISRLWLQNHLSWTIVFVPSNLKRCAQILKDAHHKSSLSAWRLCRSEWKRTARLCHCLYIRVILQLYGLWVAHLWLGSPSGLAAPVVQ